MAKNNSNKQGLCRNRKREKNFINKIENQIIGDLYKAKQIDLVL